MEKKKVSYNITVSILDEFDKMAKKTAVNKSRLVEKIIGEWIKKQKELVENK
jgi:metal-responsive CopG/Arc/MetJ family transcriptional regulator